MVKRLKGLTRNTPSSFHTLTLFFYRLLNLQAISPWKANQTPLPGHSLHKSANLMHRAHSAALWYFSPAIFFLSQSFSSLRQEFLKWAVVWKRFVVSGSSSWWKFAELEPWNVAAVSEELGHSSESRCLAAGQTKGKHWLTSSHPLLIIPLYHLTLSVSF